MVAVVGDQEWGGGMVLEGVVMDLAEVGLYQGVLGVVGACGIAWGDGGGMGRCW